MMMLCQQGDIVAWLCHLLYGGKDSGSEMSYVRRVARVSLHCVHNWAYIQPCWGCRNTPWDCILKWESSFKTSLQIA